LARTETVKETASGQSLKKELEVTAITAFTGVGNILSISRRTISDITMTFTTPILEGNLILP
jgi:hypothetical protein